MTHEAIIKANQIMVTFKMLKYETLLFPKHVLIIQFSMDCLSQDKLIW